MDSVVNSKNANVCYYLIEIINEEFVLEFMLIFHPCTIRTPLIKIDLYAFFKVKGSNFSYLPPTHPPI